ncbi:unnamed protein product [Paramecium sonneborni]|uniref:Uncharacterized protein n=1 Tax=Paramecium sonneborni TaxID=65129 RepID=A0A8S1RRZ4_9CILI|nr:unnamed protein product [Paramecium sonneborni]
MNGRKVGRWDILFCQYYANEYQKIQVLYKQSGIHSGGGSYDEVGNQKKIGKWVELDEDFNGDSYTSKQVTCSGEYNMNGIKIGRWDIMYYQKYQMEYIQMQVNIIYKGEMYIQIISGGGSYDKEGNQTKIGNWVELQEGFNNNKQITINGEYNMKGQKLGIWKELNLNQQLELMNFDI